MNDADVFRTVVIKDLYIYAYINLDGRSFSPLTTAYGAISLGWCQKVENVSSSF